jgi:PAS domain S-box-containing protein
MSIGIGFSCRSHSAVETFMMNAVYRQKTTPRLVFSSMNDRVAVCGNMTDEVQRLQDRIAQLERELAAKSDLAQHHPANLAVLLENTSDSIWSIDADRRLVFFNSNFANRYRDWFGKLPAIGMSLDQLLPPPLCDQWQELYRRVLGGESLSIQQHYPDLGMPNVYYISLQPVWHRERIVGATGFSRDVTEFQSAQENLARQSDILQSMVDNIGDGVIVVDEHGRFLIFNPAAERMLGPRVDNITSGQWTEMYALHLPDTVTPVPEDQLPLVRAMRGETVDNFLMYMRRAEQRRGTWISVNARPLIDKDGLRRGAVALVRDITQSKRAEAALAAEQQFLEQLLLAHERDRQLMAYEIHDGLVQDITGALMHLEAVWPSQSSHTSERNSFERALGLLRESLDEGRRLISGLRPPILDEQGIVAAIAYLVGEHVSAGVAAIRFNHDVHFDRLEPLLEGTLFRIAQEALNNVKRHSKAITAAVELSQIGDRIQLQIRDWGVGFEADRVDKRRFGLRGIRERARLLRGRAIIESRPGQGTRVFVEIPMPPALQIGIKRSVE